MRAGVIIPVKSFAKAKARLEPELDADQRDRLARRCASIVVAASAPLPVWIVCDDDGVAEWTRSMGAQVCWRPGRDLSKSVTDAVAAMGADFDRVIVAHGDLPLATDLPSLLKGHSSVTLVPDRHGTGTNVIVVDTNIGFRFMYGRGSFQRHRIEARRIGTDPRVVHDSHLAWDLDEPEDLQNSEVAEALASSIGSEPGKADPDDES